MDSKTPAFSRSTEGTLTKRLCELQYFMEAVILLEQVVRNL